MPRRTGHDIWLDAVPSPPKTRQWGSAYADLCRKHLASRSGARSARAEYECSLSQLASDELQIPKLLRAYLTLGAKICGPPALDRQFKTIDFLTLLDLKLSPPLARQKFLGA